jgi:hypothetical protein
MNIFSLISAGINAVRKGEVLAHPQKWKTAQAVSMALVAIAVPLYAAFCDAEGACYGISQDQVVQMATLVGGIAFSIFQLWATLATSAKVGVGRKKEKKTNEEPSDITRAHPDAELRKPKRSDQAKQVSSNASGSGSSSRDRVPGPFGY